MVRHRAEPYGSIYSTISQTKCDLPPGEGYLFRSESRPPLTKFSEQVNATRVVAFTMRSYTAKFPNRKQMRTSAAFGTLSQETR